MRDLKLMNKINLSAFVGVVVELVFLKLNTASAADTSPPPQGDYSYHVSEYEGTIDPAAQNKFETFKRFQIGFYSIIWLIGSIGGVLVIYVILFNSKLKTITNIFLLNLAIADFIYLQGIPFYLTSLINHQWVFSLFTCKMYWTFTGVNQFTAVFIITLLAYDRYLAVCRQDMIQWRKVTSSKFVLIGLWSISIICMLPIIIFSNLETVLMQENTHTSMANSSGLNAKNTNNFYVSDNSNLNTNNENYSILKSFNSCTILWPEQTFIKLELAFIFYGCLVSFLVPVVLISVFYFRIILCLKRNRSKINMLLTTKLRERKKVTYLVLSIIGIYVLTYTPYWICQIVILLINYILYQNTSATLGNTDLHQISAKLTAFSQLLVYLNSALNPFIYAFMSENFRQSFKEAIKCQRISNSFVDFFSKPNRNFSRMDSISRFRNRNTSRF